MVQWGALCVCQALREAVAERVKGVEKSNGLVNGRPAPSTRRGAARAEHVDDFAALGTDPEEGRRMATEVGEALEADGLGARPVSSTRGGDALA